MGWLCSILFPAQITAMVLQFVYFRTSDQHQDAGSARDAASSIRIKVIRCHCLHATIFIMTARQKRKMPTKGGCVHSLYAAQSLPNFSVPYGLFFIAPFHCDPLFMGHYAVLVQDCEVCHRTNFRPDLSPTVLCPCTHPHRLPEQPCGAPAGGPSR